MIRYKYEFAGKFYEGNRFNFGLNVDTERLPVFQMGDTAIIFVNPLRPNESVISFAWRNNYTHQSFLRYRKHSFLLGHVICHFNNASSNQDLKDERTKPLKPLTKSSLFSYLARLVKREIIVNITVENLAPCRKLLRVELDAKSVDETFDAITKDYQKQASLPGFRPGKAPRDLVIKKYEADIQSDARRKLIGESYRKALEEKKISVISQPDIEEIQFGRGQNLQFAATIETAPEFQLPEYKGLAVKREIKSVTDEDVERALNLLAQQHTKFETVARELKMGDVVVVNYTGTSDGKPLTEIAPTAKGLTEQKNFWVDVAPNTFIAGFAEQLIGAKAGDRRTVNVDFPADFVTKELAGKKGVFEVEIVEVKEKIAPPIDDALAKNYGAENLEKLRAGVRVDLAT